MKAREVAFYARVSSEQQATAHTILSQVAALRQRIAEEARQRELRLVITRLEDFAQRVTAGLQQADWTRRRDVIRTLVKRVDIGPDAVKVVFRVEPGTSPTDAAAHRLSGSRLCAMVAPGRLCNGSGRANQRADLPDLPIFLPRYPVHSRSGSLFQAVVAYLFVLLGAHGPARWTRFPGPVSGASWALPCSPQSAAFPPQSPAALPGFRSAASPVLCRCATPRPRAAGTYRSSLSPSVPLAI
jgi:hypothetical protein